MRPSRSYAFGLELSGLVLVKILSFCKYFKIERKIALARMLVMLVLDLLLLLDLMIYMQVTLEELAMGEIASSHKRDSLFFDSWRFHVFWFFQPFVQWFQPLIFIGFFAPL